MDWIKFWQEVKGKESLMASSILHSIHPIDAEVGERACTVRRGANWYNNPSQDVSLCYCHDGEHEIVGEARILTRTLVMFNSITDEMLEDEHEVSSRNVAGLLESMKRAYGDDFNTNEQCTIVRYWRMK